MFQFKISFQGKSELVTFEYGSEDSTTVLDFLEFIQKKYSLEEVKILKLVKGTSITSDSPQLSSRLIDFVKPNKTKRITVIGVAKGVQDQLEQQKQEQERLNEIADATRATFTKKEKKRPKGVQQYCYGEEMKVDHVGSNGKRRYCFSSASVRKELEKADQALRMVYSIINDPALLKVMEKYQWHVDLVKEITPWEEPTKLGWNMNRGQNIALRLRAGRKSFLSREEIMETMFHELAHMAIGPHNEEFRELNDQIREDYFDFAYTIDEPEAFTGIGVRLGGSRAHRDVSPIEMARRAALKRYVQLLYTSTCEYDYGHHDHDHAEEEEVMSKDVDMQD